MTNDDRASRNRIESSVVIRGLDATTFSEMESFVKDLEGRPTERLFRDLPQLAELSTAKFSLVSYVLINKYKQATDEDRVWMRESVAEAVERAEGESRERITGILARMR